MGDGGRIIVLYTLAGAAVGVLVNVLFFADPWGKTDIGEGVALVAFGLLVGSIAGSEIARRTEARPKTRAVLLACGVVSLAALCGAATGWVFANAYRPLETPVPLPDREESVTRGAWVGAALGTVSGLVLLVLQRVLYPRPVPKATESAEIPTPDRPS
jgi:hypothetical protein